MRVLFNGLAAAGLVLTSSAAEAAWHKAESKHFIIFADEEPADLAAFATKLERFDKAVRVARAMDDPTVGDGNRLTVFVLPDDAAVRKLVGDKSGFTYGYYIGRASGPVAFVPRKTDANTDDLLPRIFASFDVSGVDPRLPPVAGRGLR